MQDWVQSELYIENTVANTIKCNACAAHSAWEGRVWYQSVQLLTCIVWLAISFLLITCYMSSLAVGNNCWSDLHVLKHGTGKWNVIPSAMVTQFIPVTYNSMKKGNFSIRLGGFKVALHSAVLVKPRSSSCIRKRECLTGTVFTQKVFAVRTACGILKHWIFNQVQPRSSCSLTALVRTWKISTNIFGVKRARLKSS